jgi:hypothetical protein
MGYLGRANGGNIRLAAFFNEDLANSNLYGYFAGSFIFSDR